MPTLSLKMKNLHCHFLLLSLSCLSLLSLVHSQSPNIPEFNQPNNFEGSSDLINVEYHMGPVLASSPMNLYIVWYGHWNPTHKSTIRDFLYSLSSPAPFPSVADWWQTVRLYRDQTGSNVTGNVVISGEYDDWAHSHGTRLTRLSMQSIISSSVWIKRRLSLNYKSGLYLVLTSSEVLVEEFCRAVCGFHYFTFPSMVGVTLPYAWVGYSGTQCPGMCAYPFAWPTYSGKPPPGGGLGGVSDIMSAPNGDPGVDGMISVIAHELAEVSSNPLINAWYAGNDPTAPVEIADLCLGVYGSGGGGGYVGEVYKDSWGNGYNVNGVRGRKFLVQWVWNPVERRCFGPNAMD